MINEYDVIAQFRDAMASSGIPVDASKIIADGKIHRIHVEGDSPGSKNAWYVLHIDEHPAGAYGCNKRLGSDGKLSWSLKGAKPLTQEERRAFAQRMAKQKAQREAEERARHEAAATRANELWEAAEPADEHPYLSRKGVGPHGLRVGRWTVENDDGKVTLVSDNALLIPLRDKGKRIRSMQAIFPNKKNPLRRDKDFLRNGPKQGLFYTIGKPVSGVILICEGFATGASLHEATGHAVVVAFDTGNLGHVARVIRGALPEMTIVMCADNDQWTTEPIENPGVHYARKVASEVRAMVAIPPFDHSEAEPDPETGKLRGPTDFNDLASLRGHDAVRAAIDQALRPEVPPIKADVPIPEPEAPEPMHVPEDGVPDADHPDDPADTGGYFVMLGYDHEKYYFFQHEKKQVLVYTKNDFTDSGLIALAPLNWWEREFPAESNHSSINRRSAMDWLVRGCHKAGIYDPTRIRGRGAWIDDGRVIYHHGGYLSVDGQPTAITKIKSRYVYELDRSLPEPADSPLSDEEGARLIEIAKLFRWTKPGSAALLAGFVALAPLCGALRWRPHVWVTGGAGSGKAQPHSSGVLTPTGWRTMGEMRLGDLVSTPDNGYGRVRGVFPQGKKQVYKITFADGRTARATGDHLWKVRVKHAWRIRTTDEMMEILSTGTRQSRSLAVPLCDPMTVRNGGSALMLPIPAYVVGVMLGDGSFGNEDGAPRTGSNFLTCFDPEIVDHARSCLAGSDFDFFDTNVEGRYRLGDLSRYGRKTRETIKELRLLGARSETKFIPRAYLDASIEDRIELLKGLMDTDGFVGQKGGLVYYTTSQQLSLDVVELVRSLGGIARISIKQTHYTLNGEKQEGQPCFSISIRLKDPTIAFSLPRKLERVSAGYQYADCLYLNVVSIEPDGEEECSCIAIDHPDHLYLTDGFVVTHNSTILNDYVHPLMAGTDVFAQGNSSEAGIRQTLKKDARPVLFDETEQNDERETNRMQAVLALIRQSSTESAAQTLKGTAGGDALAFHVRSMFCLASIQVGIKHQADAERMAVLALKSKREGDDVTGNWQRIKDALYSIKRDDQLAPRLFRRSLDLLPITRKNIDLFTEVAAQRFGSQREGDQYGTLLAGAWSLISRDLATYADAENLIDQYDWSEHLETAEEDGASKAYAALMEAHIRLQGGNVVTVYELARAALGKPTESIEMQSSSADAMLQRYGMRIREGRLLISNRSDQPKKLMAGTSFEADLRGVLLRYPGADRYDNRTQRFNGQESKCISLPIAVEDDYSDGQGHAQSKYGSADFLNDDMVSF